MLGAWGSQWVNRPLMGHESPRTGMQQRRWVLSDYEKTRLVLIGRSTPDALGLGCGVWGKLILLWLLFLGFPFYFLTDVSFLSLFCILWSTFKLTWRFEVDFYLFCSKLASFLINNSSKSVLILNLVGVKLYLSCLWCFFWLFFSN